MAGYWIRHKRSLVSYRKDNAVELAQKSVMVTFSVFKNIIDDYKKLSLELEKTEE